jgi:hypothetical protein
VTKPMRMTRLEDAMRHRHLPTKLCGTFMRRLPGWIQFERAKTG